jgi:hypothetical protein
MKKIQLQDIATEVNLKFQPSVKKTNKKPPPKILNYRPSNHFVPNTDLQVEAKAYFRKDDR